MEKTFKIRIGIASIIIAVVLCILWLRNQDTNLVKMESSSAVEIKSHTEEENIEAPEVDEDIDEINDLIDEVVKEKTREPFLDEYMASWAKDD